MQLVAQFCAIFARGFVANFSNSKLCQCYLKKNFLQLLGQFYGYLYPGYIYLRYQIFISTQVKSTLGKLSLTVVKFTIGNIIPTLGNYSLVKFTPGNTIKGIITPGIYNYPG